MATESNIAKPTLSYAEKGWIIFWETWHTSSHQAVVEFIRLYTLLSEKIR